MLRDPASVEVLQLLSCSCKKSKRLTGACLCKSHGLKCADLCNCTNCENCNKDQLSDTSDEKFNSEKESETELCFPNEFWLLRWKQSKQESCSVLNLLSNDI